jgi:hypothetical protein
MKRWSASMIAVAVLLGIGVTIFPAVAKDDNKLNVSVAFGRGSRGLRESCDIPNQIETKLGGVVHFLVAGFHQVVVYKPGTLPENILVPASGTFINDSNNQYYLGINPAGGPENPPTQATPANPIVPGGDVRSNASNRVESVSFPALEGRDRTTGALLSEKAEPGAYLVICNVRAHFNDGMFAFVKVH